MKLYEIASIFKEDPGNLSKMLSGKRKISWPFALKLSKKLPERDVEGWKNATPEEIKAAIKDHTTSKGRNDFIVSKTQK